MKLSWNPEKSEQLIAERGINFEEIEQAIDHGVLLDVTKHPKRETQV